MAPGRWSTSSRACARRACRSELRHDPRPHPFEIQRAAPQLVHALIWRLTRRPTAGDSLVHLAHGGDQCLSLICIAGGADVLGDAVLLRAQPFNLLQKLSAACDFVPLHEPECNIVVFRYVPEAMRNAPAEVIGRLQLELRRRLIESGQFYIVSTRIDGVGALRVTIINPLTTPDHLDQLLDAIRKTAATLL